MITAFESQAAARKRIQTLKSELKTWAKVSSETGINKGLLWSIAKGRKPAPDSVLVALRIINEPARMVAIEPGYDVAPVCAVCGQVHVTKTCTANRKPRMKKSYRIRGARQWKKSRTGGANLI